MRVQTLYNGVEGVENDASAMPLNLSSVSYDLDLSHIIPR